MATFEDTEEKMEKKILQNSIIQICNRLLWECPEKKLINFAHIDWKIIEFEVRIYIFELAQ